MCRSAFKSHTCRSSTSPAAIFDAERPKVAACAIFCRGRWSVTSRPSGCTQEHRRARSKWNGRGRDLALPAAPHSECIPVFRAPLLPPERAGSAGDRRPPCISEDALPHSVAVQIWNYFLSSLVLPAMATATFLSSFLVVTFTVIPFFKSSSLQALPSQVITASAATVCVISFLVSLSVITNLLSPALTTFPVCVSSSAASAGMTTNAIRAHTATRAKRLRTITRPPFAKPWYRKQQRAT